MNKIINNKGKPIFGVWNIINEPSINEIIGLSGYDFQILDMEHGTHDISTIQNSIRACELTKCIAFVRLPIIDIGLAQKVLDSGAVGLLIPQIKSVEDAQKAIEILNFPPIGIRGYNPFTRNHGYGASSPYNLNTKFLAGVIIENNQAWHELDNILSLENLDIVYLGIYDMSIALGKHGKYDDPELLNFIETGIKKITKANKIAGLMCNKFNANYYIKLGATFLVVGVDSSMISENFKKIREDLKW